MAEILPLDEVKAYLRVDGDDDDAVIKSLTDATLAEIENYCGLVATARSMEFSFDSLSGELFIPRRPVHGETVSIHYDDDNGDEQSVTGFRVMTAQGWSTVAAPSSGWPASGARRVRLAVTVGHRPSDAYPADVLLAAKMTIDARYDDRGAGLAGTSILDRYCAWRV